jgi:hypothetical protein
MHDQNRVTRLGEFSPIGRVTNFWGTFCENYISCTTSWATFFNGESCVLIIKKIGLGYILGDFFTNASGHPGSEQEGGGVVRQFNQN